MKTTYVFVFVVFQDVGAPDPNIWQAKWHLLPRSSVLKMKMRPNLATTFLHSSKKTEKISETCIEIKIHQIMNSVESFRCWLLIFLVFWMFVKLECFLLKSYHVTLMYVLHMNRFVTIFTWLCIFCIVNKSYIHQCLQESPWSSPFCLFANTFTVEEYELKSQQKIPEKKIKVTFMCET